MVEVLVASAVLVLLIVMVAQLVGGANAVILNSNRHTAADDQARIVFDRMAKDFAGMPKRKDVDYIFTTGTAVASGGNDSMYFYSEAPAFFDASPALSNQSTMGLVGYNINSSYQLQRLGKGLTWDGAPSTSGGGMIFLPNTITNSWNSIVTTGSDQDFHVLADGVFRMQFCYLLKSGSFSAIPSISGTSGFNGFQDVSAIVVAIAILDSNSRKLLSGTSAYGNLVTALPETTGTAPPAQAWVTSSTTATFYSSLSGVPIGAARNIRIYQRAFYLNTAP